MHSFPQSIVFKTFPISFGKIKYQYQKYYLSDKIQKFLSQNYSQFKDLDKYFYAAEQVHGKKISIIKENKFFYPNSDGLITNKKNQILTIRHADCIPIFLFDPKKKLYP